MGNYEGLEIKGLPGFQVKPLKRVTTGFVESEKVFFDGEHAFRRFQHPVHLGDPLLLGCGKDVSS